MKKPFIVLLVICLSLLSGCSSESKESRKLKDECPKTYAIMESTIKYIDEEITNYELKDSELKLTKDFLILRSTFSGLDAILEEWKPSDKVVRNSKEYTSYAKPYLQYILKSGVSIDILDTADERVNLKVGDILEGEEIKERIEVSEEEMYKYIEDQYKKANVSEYILNLYYRLVPEE